MKQSLHFPQKPTNHRMPCKERGGGFYLFIRWTKKFVSPLKLRKRKKPYKDKTTQAYLSVFKNRGTEDFKVYFLSSLNPQSGFIPFFSGWGDLDFVHSLVLFSLPKQIKSGSHLPLRMSTKYINIRHSDRESIRIR